MQMRQVIPRFARLAPLAIVGALVYSCGGEPTKPRVPKGAIAIASNQTAVAGTAVGNSPGIFVMDEMGGGIGGIAYTVVVTAGGGTIERSSGVTDDDGNGMV